MANTHPPAGRKASPEEARADTSGDRSAKCADYGRGAHRNIAAHFQLDSDRLPLLKLDLFNWDEPFTDVLHD